MGPHGVCVPDGSRLQPGLRVSEHSTGFSHCAGGSRQLKAQAGPCPSNGETEDQPSEEMLKLCQGMVALCQTEESAGVCIPET